MAWRFRKVFSLGKGIKLNISKRSLGVSVGMKGLRIGMSTRGPYISFGIPGTGIYGIKRLGSSKSSSNKRGYKEEVIFYPPELGIGNVVKVAIGIFLLGLILLFFTPTIGELLLLASITVGIGFLFYKIKGRRLYKKAKIEAEYGNYEEAIKLLKEVLNILERPPALRAPNLHYELSQLYHKAGQPQEAYLQAKEYYSSGPQDITTILRFAYLAIEIEHPEIAIEAIEKLPSEIKKELTVINLKALAYLKMNKPDLALKVLEEGPVGVRHTNTEDMLLFRYLLRRTYKELGETKKAINQLKKVYTENPEYEDVKELRSKPPTSGELCNICKAREKK